MLRRLPEDMEVLAPVVLASLRIRPQGHIRLLSQMLLLALLALLSVEGREVQLVLAALVARFHTTTQSV